MGLLDAFKQYWRDASPGGVLNPEIPKDTPILGLLADPIGSMKSTISSSNEKAKRHLALLSASTADARRTGKLFGSPAQDAYERDMSEFVVNNVGPLMFIGKGAKTWNQAAADRALQMQKEGKSAREIWPATGTWVDTPDGVLRQEISDHAATGQFTHIPERGTNRLADRALVHPQIYDAYPKLNNISQIGLRGSKSGRFETIGDQGMITATAPTESGVASIGAHEVQHAIQNIEGFARGGNLDSVKQLVADRKQLKSKFDSAVEQLKSSDDPIAKQNALQEMSFYGTRLGKLPKVESADEAYRLLAGEAEARATQARMNLTPEQRLATFPADSYDVPMDQLIVRKGLFGEPQMSTAVRDTYVGGHKAPMKGSGAPLHDLTQVYPDDIYSPKAMQYYGTGEPALDRGTFRKVGAYKGNPDAPVTMYRAVPDTVPADAKINNGDWVTINPEYAKLHGDGPLGGSYRVLQQQVPARKLFTNGDSIHEFGYDESGRILPGLLGLLAGGTGAGVAGYNWLTDR